MTRPILICLHAITRSGSDFIEFSARLRRTFDVLAPDLIGHGAAPRSSSYTIRDYLDGVISSLGHLDEEANVFIWGHSLGGLIAVALAQHLSRQLQGLFVEDAPLFETDWPRFREGPFYAGFVELRRYLGKHQKTLDLHELAFEIGKWPSGNMISSYADYFGKAGVLRRAEQLLAFDLACLDEPIHGRIKNGFDVQAALADIDCPIRLLSGNRANGSALTVADISQVQQLGRSVEVDMFPDLGHDIRLFRLEDCQNRVMTLRHRQS